MNKKYIIWGAGHYGKEMKNAILEEGHEIIAYCDSVKRGKIEGYDIVNIDRAIELCNGNKDIEVIVAILDETINLNIENIILEKFPKGIKYKLGTDIYEDVQNLCLKRYYKNMDYKWNVNLRFEFVEWMNNIDSEVEYWTKFVANKDGAGHEQFEIRRNNKLFNHCKLKDIVKKNSIVLDIGCGLVSKYGNILPDGNKVNLLPVDALSHFYNKINSYIKDGKKEDYKCSFGMFEFIANAFDENYADAIIINNALDHGIDPFRSLVECLHVLKVNGVLCMVHRRAEALYELWTGLHRWNMDCINGDLILWNKENAINVSTELKEYVDIEVKCDETARRIEQMVFVKIIKKRSFDINNFINTKNDSDILMDCINTLMKRLADDEGNFFELLKNNNF